MNRSLFYSLMLHLALVIGLIILSFVEPLRPEKKLNLTRVHLIPSGPKVAPKPVQPVATPAPPKPTPPPPKKTPPPEPKTTPPPKKEVVKKEPKKNKEIVKKTKDIVEKVTPKPTPEPTPDDKPKEKETPKPEKSAEPTAAPTEAPKDTPAPTPAPKVDLPTEPAEPAVATASLQSSLQQWELGENYAGRALFLIEQNFRPPSYRPGVTCVITFNILRDGTIPRDSVRVKTSSGWPDLDQSAVRAVINTGKLPELYDTFTKPYMEVSVTFEFDRRI